MADEQLTRGLCSDVYKCHKVSSDAQILCIFHGLLHLENEVGCPDDPAPETCRAVLREDSIKQCYVRVLHRCTQRASIPRGTELSSICIVILTSRYNLCQLCFSPMAGRADVKIAGHSTGGRLRCGSLATQSKSNTTYIRQFR